MKTNLQVYLFLLFIQINVSAQSNKLTVIIKDIRSNEGLVGMQLLDEHENVIKGMYLKIINKKASVVLENLSAGNYAVRIYHDENQNDKMDNNWMGIPKEGFGFSGKSEKKFGAPDIKDMLFQLNSDKTITVKMMYVF
ncbi:MAG: DUF2141 domain-containing protein [Bacteroidales bacterium]|nr:DUF2141 domain-containing protein [Bacteroidales bacterium]